MGTMMFCKNIKIVLIFIFLSSWTSTLTTETVTTPEDDMDPVATEAIEEELHMDTVPVGHLPDNVYRELAWYGIQQTQPLYRSAKYKAAARLIHQHTLGRPNVILDTPPQGNTAQETQTRGVIAEEAAKWSKGQRGALEILIENIKVGGNGITVRTVYSASKRTDYIIHDGKFYRCPSGSEPDLDAYRDQPNIHFANCTNGRTPISVPIDPCIEAESVPIEFSFNEGWMFCFGTGDRENSYFPNGTLDCGNKTKMSIEKFLNMCAIDHNVVIWYKYYGDEPRKDLLINSTMCQSYDPCALTYLYRLETPPVELLPAFPATTPNPCDSTVCDECLEGFTGEPGVVVDIMEEDSKK